MDSVNIYKELLQRRVQIMDEKLELNRKKAKNEERVRAFTDREWRNPDYGGNLDADGNYRVDPPDDDGVAEDVINYSVTYPGRAPWTVSRTGEGDLYISRHGKAAGTPHRERQGPNDLAITLDQNVLLPDFMYYVFQFLQPEIAARARGTAQQYITRSDIDEVLTSYFRRQVAPIEPTVKEDGGDIYSDPNLPPDRHAREASVNYVALNPAKVVLTQDKEFSVGIDTISSPADAAHVLASIRKNAQEGFWGVVTDDAGKILGIVEHSKGAIDGTSVYVSVIAGHVLQIPGAAKVWWGHNHPSGNLNPSSADETITRRIEDLMRGTQVEIQGHVLMAAGRDRFTTMDAQGATISMEDEIRPAARDRKVPVYTRTIRGKNQVGEQIANPQDAVDVFERLGWPEGLVFVNTKHEVIGYMEMTTEEMKNLRGTGNSDRILRAASEMNASRFFALSATADPDAAANMAAFGEATSAALPMLDFFYKDHTGVGRSMQAQGAIPTQQTFYQDLVGFTSGLLEAAKNMPQAKGPAEQMIAVLKKQPGVKKEEYDWLEVEDWIRAKGYVTRDEIIDFIDKNGVVVEEHWLGEQPGAIKDPILDMERVAYEDLDLSADRFEGMDEADFIDGRMAVFDVQDDANDLYFTVIHDADAGNVYVWDDDTNAPIPVDTPMNTQNLEDAVTAIREHIETRQVAENRFVGAPRHTDYTLSAHPGTPTTQWTVATISARSCSACRTRMAAMPSLFLAALSMTLPCAVSMRMSRQATT
jgi:DNA repair protein RadC